MKKKIKKLQLSRETVQVLASSDALKVAKGAEIVGSCPSGPWTGVGEAEPCACQS
jgi:hypothetical protein